MKRSKRPKLSKEVRPRSFFLVLALAVAAVGTVLLYRTTAGHTALRTFAPRIVVAPKQAAVFRGDSLQFEAAVVGAAGSYTVNWSVIGPGSIDSDGLYQAPNAPALANVVASAGSGLADSATVQTMAAPSAQRSLALVSCYDDATVDVHDAAGLAHVGSLSLRGRTAGVAIDARARRALIAADGLVYALDLTSMHWKASSPLNDARFSQVALLAGGLFAVTDNNAQNGRAGVRLFRIDAAGVPLLISSIAAGETPEGISVADAGRTFYVTNVNSNSVMRFALRADNSIRRTGVAATGTRPFGVAVDPVHQLLFVADNDTATISGARSRPGLERFALPSLRRVGSVISTGSPTSLPLGVVVDPGLNRLFVVNEGDGNVIVYDLPSMRRRDELSVGLTPWLPSVDRRLHRLFVPNARANSMDVYDTRFLRAVRRNVPTCSYPTFIGLSAS